MSVSSRTAEYYDDVLGAKMRSLVSGAIKRARLEKVEPMISYEHFVEDLDRGDSFTTSLIEVLVKEVAERRRRQNEADRGLIADRTARSLRRLSSPASVYRERIPGRGTGGRRGVDLAEYLSQPPNELDLDDDDDDELGPYSAFVPVMEGTRLNTDLYEAYRSSHWSSSLTPHASGYPYIPPASSSVPTADSASDRVLPPLVDASPPTRSASAWPLPSASGLLHSSSLSRQPSLRRPGRSRASDFNEFTAARRSSTRQLAQDEEPASRSESSIATALDVPPPSSLRSSTDEHPTSRGSSSQARRFFPFGRARRFEIIPTPRPATSTSDDWFFPPHSGWATNLPERTGAAYTDDDSSDERSQAPRLRRGGLRAPEAMLSRHSSPLVSLPPPHELFRATPASVPNTSATTAATTIGGNENTPLPAERSASEEVAQSIGGP
ncbi:hypothetical protein HYDPIDRAFT_77071 [Hydnomerulius pinastri MD-312]|nr:hypothetical protein HYDPIDRAFT_77071 [Hydnomerulius pinastri MD-312]